MKKQALNPKLTHRNKVFSKKVSESQKTAPKTPNTAKPQADENDFDAIDLSL